jgi:tetratricopeptide (TPR) repeat protein
MRSGNKRQALALLFDAASKTSARENEYLPVLVDLRQVLVDLGHFRHALTIDWYARDARNESTLLERVPEPDQARTLQAWAERDAASPRAVDYYRRAAEIYEHAGIIAHAAICRERSKDAHTARALWSRLAQALASSGAERYAAGLARFNLARTCMETGDRSAARAAVVSAVHLLEEAADHYARIGQRERAFDCYQVLIAIGKHSGEFEHVLEGFVNVVRILREDNLRYYALQSYEDALSEAKDNGEFTAGATLAQEMASYAANEGLMSVANHANQLGASMWEEVARAAIERGVPAEMAENAMLAAVVAYARQGQFQDVGRLYTTLSKMDLEEARCRHYDRAAKRYTGVHNTPVDAAPLPSHLRQDAAFPEVWHVDLVEWEQRGSAAAACGDVVLDPESWSEVTRRRALIARMQALDSEAGVQPAALVRLAELLGQVELYTILSPLEHLYTHQAPEVRLAVVQALERFMYKRTFVTVRSSLADADAGVRKRAYQTVEALRFPHAFDPLSRIFRESEDQDARAAALRAIARIDTNEAAELLLGVFEHEGRPERAAAAEALKRARGTVFLDVARQAMPTLSEQGRAQLREVFHARGEMV